VAVGAPMQTNDDLDWWEHRIETVIEGDTAIPPTDRRQLSEPGAAQGSSDSA
jgi:hypothetical protein